MQMFVTSLQSSAYKDEKAHVFSLAEQVYCIILQKPTRCCVLNDQITYSLELAQFYMWAQTQQYIFIAIHIPTGNT